jgi:NAD(P)-dependent dehydrogenase (short-subunit alcohol dehydrogenase family)
MSAASFSGLKEESMPVIAILGAGRGMGRAIAKLFGAHGFRVALLSPSPLTLDPIVADLIDDGIVATAVRADVLDHPSIASGLTEVTRRLGPIDVLEFSPADATLPLASATELTHDNVQLQIDVYVHGAVAAVNHVLPDMLARRPGTIIFTTGASAVHPVPMFGNTGAAMAWLRNWAHTLHAAVAPKGVQVGLVAIGARIGRQPGATPDAIAPLYWELHRKHEQVEKVFLLDVADWLPEARVR